MTKWYNFSYDGLKPKLTNDIIIRVLRSCLNQFVILLFQGIIEIIIIK